MDTQTFFKNFPKAPKKVYSQTGEEGILEYIFSHFQPKGKYLVDFGAGDGTRLSNTKLLLENGWQGLRMDGKAAGDVKQEFITAENIVSLFKKYQVPQTFDLLSIDMDGNDYWVLKEILKVYKPLVIVAEINGCLEPYQSVAMKYNPTHTHEGNDYYGASFQAFKELCKDYVVVHNRHNLNIFLVHKELIGDIESPVTCIKDQYHHHSPNREWVTNPIEVEVIGVEYTELAPDGTEFIPFEGSEAEAKVKAYKERFPADDEQVTTIPVPTVRELAKLVNNSPDIKTVPNDPAMDNWIEPTKPAPKKRGRPSKKK